MSDTFPHCFLIPFPLHSWLLDLAGFVLFLPTLPNSEDMSGGGSFIRSGNPSGMPWLQAMPYKIHYVSAEAPSCEAKHMLERDKQKFWSSGGSLKQTLILKMNSVQMLGYLNLFNKSTSQLQVSVSMVDNNNKYVCVLPVCKVPHNRTTSYQMGFVPCRYVKIECVTGNPVSLYSVQLTGTTPEFIRQKFGSEQVDLLCENTKRLLFSSAAASSAGAPNTEGVAKGCDEAAACGELNSCNRSSSITGRTVCGNPYRNGFSSFDCELDAIAVDAAGVVSFNQKKLPNSNLRALLPLADTCVSKRVQSVSIEDMLAGHHPATCICYRSSSSRVGCNLG